MIRPAADAADYAVARKLIAEYIDWLPFELDFQDYEAELADLENHYAPPEGALLLVTDAEESAIGIVGVRRWGHGIAELKRMYVRPAGRGAGLGRRLAEAAITFAKNAGYAAIRLDSAQDIENRENPVGWRHIAFRRWTDGHQYGAGRSMPNAADRRSMSARSMLVGS